MNDEKPVAYLVFAITSSHKDDIIEEFVEHIYWIAESSPIAAFDRATQTAVNYAATCSTAIEEKREFVGISEVLPIWEAPSDGSRIGNRVYSKDEKQDIEEGIMSREEFLELISP